MTTAEIAGLFIMAAGSLGTIAAVILSNRDTKRTMSVSWGKLLEKVDANEQRLGRVEEKVDEHAEQISYLKGKANGVATGRMH